MHDPCQRDVPQAVSTRLHRGKPAMSQPRCSPTARVRRLSPSLFVRDTTFFLSTDRLIEE
jgi:hypothetical protein